MNRLLAFVTAASLSVVAGCDATSNMTDPSRLVAGGARDNMVSNSDAAHACQNGGWQTLMGSDGTRFHNTGDCVSYAAQGGTLVPIPTTPTITGFTFDGIVTVVTAACPAGIAKAAFTAVFSNGTGTITDVYGTVTPVTSGVQIVLPAEGGDYVLTVTNSSGSVTQTLSNPANIPIGGVWGCPATDFSRRPPTGLGRISSGT